MSLPALRRSCSARSRLLAVCLSSATLLAVVAPMTGAPAAAADADGWSDVALWTDGDPVQGFGLPRLFTLPNGPVMRFLPGDDSVFVSVRSTSAEGDRVVTLETDPEQTRSRLVVRDISGAVVRVMATYDGINALQTAALSPSGDRVAWSTLSAGSERPVVHTAPVSGGTPTTVPGAEFLMGFAAEDLLVLGVVGGGLLTATFDGQLTPITFLDGGTPGWEEVSRDGTRVAFRRTSSAPGALTRSDLYSAEVLRVGNAITVGPALLLTPEPVTPATTSPSPVGFTRDGQDLVFLQGNVQFGATSFATVPAAGGPRTVIGTSLPSNALIGNAHLGAQETSAPAAPTSVGPAVLDGTRASIPYAVAPDPTASRVVVTRTSPGQPTVTREAVVPAPVQDTGLVIGRTYTYSVRQVDRSGNQGTATTLRLTATTPPALTFADPTSRTSTTPSFVVRYAAPGNAPTTRYTVGQQTIGGTPSVWAATTTAPARLFGHPGAAPTVAPTTSRPGATYGFAGYADDQFGNRTLTTTSGRAVVPIDQRGLTTRGLTAQLTRPGAYGGTTAFLRRAGADINARVTGDRLQVIGERSATTGALDVYLNGQRLARVDTRGPRGARQVLWSQDFPTSRTGVLTVRAVGTPGRPTVVIDAISQRARP